MKKNDTLLALGALIFIAGCFQLHPGLGLLVVGSVLMAWSVDDADESPDP
jgi:hypothetical protein